MTSHLCTLLLVGVCLVFTTGMLDQVQEEQEAELGSPATLQCKNKTGFRDCTWTVDSDMTIILKSTYPELHPPGYSLTYDANTGTCALQIDAVKAEDMGKWSCVLDITRNDIKLIVTKRPEENNLIYNDRLVDNGARVGVVPDADKKAQVACESKYGLPRPIITWKVNNQNASDEDIIFTDEGGSDIVGFHVKSVLTLKYPTEEPQPMGYGVPERNPDLQKEVYCTIKYSQDEAKAIELHAIFGEEVETTDAVLEVLSGNHEKERILHCDANGIPEPDYQIVRTEPDPENYVVKSQNRTVTENGKYICKAGNWLNRQLHQSNVVTVDFGGAVYDESLKTVDGAAVILPCRSSLFSESNRDAYVQNSGRSHHSSFGRVRDSFDELCFWIHDDTTTVFSHRPSATPEYQIISGAGPALQCDLLIHRVRKEQQGDWYCTRGMDPRQKVQLEVADLVGGREPDVTAVEGYSAFLPCNAKTSNDLCFWTHGTQVIFSENHRNSPGYDIVSNPEKGNCNLLIRKAQETDAGSWYCHVFGNGPIKMELEVKKL